ncbi:ribonucleoside diphosphate reductase small subunit [Pseudomonas phage Ettore]|nr:ribonucleoside diphosphate reductase small subunit [Pseudomonas phage Ettore]
MKFKTFEPEQFDATKEAMFFGRPINVSRFDRQKYSFFEKQTRKQIGFFWVPEEIAMDQDKDDFHRKLDAAGKHIFTSNLSYQILLDSVQGRAPNIALTPFVSIPELEGFILAWTFMESIHSRSYSHLIRNVYHDPKDVLDNVVKIEPIVERASAVTKYYDEFIEYGNWYNMLGYGNHIVNGKEIDINPKKLMTLFYKMMVAINILEGVRFYVSFACTWAYSESLKLMNKSAKIIKMICRDENVHLAVTTTILKKFADGSEGEAWKQIAENCKDEVYAMYEEAVQQEREWADYLFKDGSIVGLSSAILKQYVEFIADRRLHALGMQKIYKHASNPLPWTEHWIGSKTTQVAPQEEEITSYTQGGVKNDISEIYNTGFSLD